MHLFVIAFAFQQPTERFDLGPAISHDLFGVAIDQAGDLDGDGIGDLWIGDPSRFAGERNATGSAWAVSGRTGKALRRIPCPDGATRFGWTVARIEDVNGDGVPDVAVAAQSVAGGFISDPLGKGSVNLFSGKDGTQLRSWLGPADCNKISWYSAGAGPSLACVGDWNGDGAGDVAIGWSYYDSEEGRVPDNGHVEVVSGKDGARLGSWFGFEAHDRFGFAIAALPDVDGDGKRELAASAMPDYDAKEPSAHPNLARIRPGYVCILSSKGEQTTRLPNPDGDRRFGFSLRWLGPAKAGPHLAIGQAHYSDREACAWVVDSLEGDAPARIRFPGLHDWKGESGGDLVHGTPAHRGPEVSFGSQVLELRDFDGDGQRDILVTMPQSFCMIPAVVLSAKSGAVVARLSIRDRWAAYSHVGNAVSALPDVDGDGIEDFAIGGASLRCGGECDGLVLIVSGKDVKPIRWIVRHELAG